MLSGPSSKSLSGVTKILNNWKTDSNVRKECRERLKTIKVSTERISDGKRFQSVEYLFKKKLYLRDVRDLGTVKKNSLFRKW